MKNKKKLALVFGITKDFDFALANVLLGIKNKSGLKNYDVIVYHDGIEETKMECLNKIIPCEFILYKNKISNGLLSDEYLKLYSNMCLVRFECFDLLKQYEMVLWNDVDILIQKDMTGLLEYGKKTGLAMTYNDINFMVEANFEGVIDEYNMFLPLLNSGIIVFTDKLRDYDKMTAWCYECLQKYAQKLRYLDQGVLNLLVQEFDIKVEDIDISKYCCHPARKHYEDAAIVHAYGYDKFWNSENLKKQFPLWVENDEEWGSILREYRKLHLKKKPLISVVISLYERYTYFDEALTSILNQTFQDFEVIIVLEKCSEQEKIAHFIEAYNDSRIRVIKNSERIGFAASLNVGIRVAQGKYIARMDDDDISLPWRFEKQYAYLETHPDIDILGTNVRVFMHKNYESHNQTDPEKIKTFTLINNQMYHPTVMMRKDIIEKYDLYYSTNYKTEDAELWSRAVKYVKMTNLSEILLLYRFCSENETAMAVEEVFKSDVKIIDKQLKENLDLELTEKELYLVSGRVSHYAPVYNKSILTEKKKACLKIYNKNKKKKYYNEQYLAEVLELNMHKYSLKGLLKKMIRPIYSRLMYRIECMVDGKIYDAKIKEK